MEGLLPGRKEQIIPNYTALFVENIPALLEKFPPKHLQIYGHHSTIAYEPGSLEGIEVGKKLHIKILGRAYDEKGDALLVENTKSGKKHPHITLSCAEGVPPEYSNELLDKAINSGSIEYFDNQEEMDMTEGYSDGIRDYIK